MRNNYTSYTYNHIIRAYEILNILDYIYIYIIFLKRTYKKQVLRTNQMMTASVSKQRVICKVLSILVIEQKNKQIECKFMILPFFVASVHTNVLLWNVTICRTQSNVQIYEKKSPNTVKMRKITTPYHRRPLF